MPFVLPEVGERGGSVANLDARVSARGEAVGVDETDVAVRVRPEHERAFAEPVGRFGAGFAQRNDRPRDRPSERTRVCLGRDIAQPRHASE